ncbi:MAG: autotransporter-associated beta strand repeat-containing protein [Bacteroidota bacterium]
MIKKITLTLLTLALFLTINSWGQTTQFWRIDGTGATWTGSFWGSSAAGPFTTGWTSGNHARFTANSNVTFATTVVGNVTVDPGFSVTVSQAGTASGTVVRTYDIGTGGTLTWTGQGLSTSSGFGVIKNGAGTWDMGAQGNAFNATNGGYQLNAGTVIVGGNNCFGGSATILTINGGTIQSSSTRTYSNPIVIGGDFAHSGTGNATFTGTVGLGAATRVITNSTTSGSRQYSGIISGAAGSGMTFSGSGAAQIYIGNTGNTFNGPISINGGEVVFNDNGALAATTSITIDGGRLTMASMNSSGTATALTAATIATAKNIFLGNTAGTAISVQGATGITTYNGVIANKVSTTAGSWAKQGSGTLVLGGSSTYSGATDINNGIIQITGNDRLPLTSTLNLGQAASANTGTLNLNGFSQQVVGLNSTTGVGNITKNIVNSSSSATLAINASNNFTYGIGTAVNSGIISGAVSIVKSGTGIQTLGDINTYTGVTQINAGELRFCPSASESLSSSAVTLNGGTLGTSGITAASVLSFSTLNVTNNSTISLSSASAHTVNFASSNALSWTPSTTLVVTGWQGTYNSTQGSSGTFGKIFVGANATALTSNQLSKIRFFDGTSYYYATLLSTGELVPFLGTKLTIANCAYTSTSTIEFIWADSIGTPSINAANRYRFLLINGASSFTWTTNNEWPIMQFYLISGIANATAYSTSIAWSPDGGTTWSPYGPECNLTSPSGTTQLTGSSCGSSPATFNTIIYANFVPNATQYQYQLINSSLSYTQSIVKCNNNFILSQFTGLTNNTTYSVTVRVNMGLGFGSYGTSCNVTTPGAPTTQLTAGSCGSSPASYNTLLFADAIGGATQYQYKLMNTSLSYTQTYIKSNNNFILSQFTNLQNNTTYSVTVCVYFNSAWQPYGSSCNVTTPGSPTTQLTAGSCGSSPASYNTLLFADAIGGATQYEYRLINSSLSYTQSFIKSNNNFILSQFSGLVNNTTYTISVRPFVNSAWSNFGTACSVTTPGNPTTQLASGYCGIIASSFSQLINADAILGATQYEYRLINSNLSYTQSFVKTNQNFNLSQFTGLAFSTTYTVQVRVYYNSIWGNYGSACNITTSSTLMAPLPENTMLMARLGNIDYDNNDNTGSEFDAMVYPNPCNEMFAINLVRYNVHEQISIRVFDATGKLIEKYTLAPSEVSTINIGTQYTSGIYNIVISQANKTKAIKVVKS